MKKVLSIVFPILLLLFSCEQEAQGKWIQGNKQEQLNTIEKQFRGFDMAMVETGYRYQELYWAGKDKNWDYAKYQVEKIQKTIKNGLERRPKRAKSAKHFLTVVLPEMKRAVEKKDTVIFNKKFELLTGTCNSCHALENVPHFFVKAPLYRVSPIRK